MDAQEVTTAVPCPEGDCAWEELMRKSVLCVMRELECDLEVIDLNKVVRRVMTAMGKRIDFMTCPTEEERLIAFMRGNITKFIAELRRFIFEAVTPGAVQNWLDRADDPLCTWIAECEDSPFIIYFMNVADRHGYIQRRSFAQGDGTLCTVYQILEKGQRFYHHLRTMIHICLQTEQGTGYLAYDDEEYKKTDTRLTKKCGC